MIIIKFLLLFTTLSNCECARILGVFPFPSISHQVVYRPLMHELAKMGHEVVVVTTDPAFPKGEPEKNLQEIDVGHISYNLWTPFKITARSQYKDNLGGYLHDSLILLNQIFEQQVKSDNFQRVLGDTKRKFDLIIIESVSRLPLVFSHIYNAPVIILSCVGGVHGTLKDVGAIENHLFYPMCTSRKIYNLTTWETLKELYRSYSIDRVFDNQENYENEMLNRLFGPNIPEISVLKNNIHLMMLNTYPALDFNRPVPPNVIYVGGIQQRPVKELPKDLKSYLDASSKGVIYMSFGTNVNVTLLPLGTIKIFTEVFSRLPYNILWKWDGDSLRGRSSNVKISKWLPQSDLLRHPNVKLFITHGGLQSTEEALTAGVPLLGFPLMADQYFNTEHYANYKIGLKMNIDTLTEEKLKNGIETIINDVSFRQNIENLRHLLRDQIESPLGRAVWWTEYILRNGGLHLRPPTFNSPWLRHYSLEVVHAAFAATLLIFFITIILLVKSLICQSYRKRKHKTL